MFLNHPLFLKASMLRHAGTVHLPCHVFVSGGKRPVLVGTFIPLAACNHTLLHYVLSFSATCLVMVSRSRRLKLNGIVATRARGVCCASRSSFH